MATDINRATISGNLTSDPVIRLTASGMTVMNFSVAVNGRVKNNQTGEWEDNANFVDCVMFGKRAESVSHFLTKGTKVFVDGSLRFSKWDDNNGGKRSKLEIVVDEVVFINSNGQQAGCQQQTQAYQQPPQYAPQQYTPQQQYQQQGYQQSQQYAQPQPVQQQMPMMGANQSVYDDDIPF